MSENSVVKIFQHVLENNEATASSDFFELGGDSLLATRVLSAIMREYSVELSLSDFYEAPNPSALYKQIKRENV